MKKIISMALTFMIMLAMVVTPVLATTDWRDDLSKINGAEGSAETESITNIGQSIVKIVGTIGMIVAVVVLIALGIKYMMGSAEEKAEYKKTLLPYVIGAVLIFAASAIATMVYNFAHTIQA